MEEQQLGAQYGSGVPRRWYKLEGGIKLGDKVRGWIEQGQDFSDTVKDAAEASGAVDENGEVKTQKVLEAVDSMLPEEDFNVFKLHHYDGSGSTRDLPTEVYFSTKDEEDFTSEAFRVQEKTKTTERTEKNYDDSINHLNVLHQVVQGEGHGYAHRSDLKSEDSITIGDLEGLVGDILKGRDDEEWVVESDTGPWTSIMDPSPVDFYRMAPDSKYIFDHPEADDSLGYFMDGYRDMIDLIVSDYEKESEAWSDVTERNYEDLSEHLDEVSEKGLKRLVESFPDQIDELYEQARKV